MQPAITLPGKRALWIGMTSRSGVGEVPTWFLNDRPVDVTTAVNRVSRPEAILQMSREFLAEHAGSLTDEARRQFQEQIDAAGPQVWANGRAADTLGEKL